MSGDKNKINEQEEYRIEKLEPLLKEACNGEKAVFFLDAAHFVYKSYLGYLWCFVRTFICSPCGRKRFNVLGAVNAVTKEIIILTNETYINSETVCQMLFKLASLGLNIPSSVVLDNARYQRCRLVQDYAEDNGIQLCFLPSYSPQLNIIERFWRYVKKECLYSKYYENFANFKAAISNCIDLANTDKKEKLNSLLNLKFQSFRKVQILTV
ncbi:hypothetical protein CAL7716_061940 [Calothrix sp. PCC 7716]|nr:hypothetical protein CAL7716_061940 [Calothrix sp. PCC 7716]